MILQLFDEAAVLLANLLEDSAKFFIRILQVLVEGLLGKAPARAGLWGEEP